MSGPTVTLVAQGKTRKYLELKPLKRKMTKEKATQIRSRYEQGVSRKDLAVEFNVGRSTIDNVINRKYKSHN